MRYSHGDTWLSKGRAPKNQRGKIFVIAGLVGLALILFFSFSGDDDAESSRNSERVSDLDTPDWSGDELNRPSLPDSGVTLTELSVEENNDDPLHIIGKVQRNQTLFVALRNRGLLPDRIQSVIAAMDPAVFQFRRARPGDSYEARLDLDGNILEFRYQQSREDIYVARLMGDQYVAEKVVVPKEIAVVRLEGKVSGSVFSSFAALGESAEIAQEFMDLFAFDFDFGTNSMQGDRFRLLVEKIYLDGEFYKYGRVLAAEYQTTEHLLTAYFWDPDASDDKRGEYYNREGDALRRMFLKAPIRNAKKTSPYGMRFHPILKRQKLHAGIDWAASTGTPVIAIADGTIDFIGWKGGNGNLVILAHDHGYTSMYAHLNGFKRGLKKGDEVKQREVVGYVGNTGLSTAPHLHFGMKRNGKYFDPATLDTTKGPSLTGKRLRQFGAAREELQALLDGKKPLEPPRMVAPPRPEPDDK